MSFRSLKDYFIAKCNWENDMREAAAKKPRRDLKALLPDNAKVRQLTPSRRRAKKFENYAKDMTVEQLVNRGITRNEMMVDIEKGEISVNGY